MSNSQMSARVGLFFLLGVALIWVTFEALGRSKFDSRSSYTLTAKFKTVKELKAGDEVRMAGVRVGEVVRTRLAGRRAEAVLAIDSKVEVASDAVATIAMAGLLGSNYVAISLGSESAPALEPGAVIASADTADLNALFTQLGEIGRKVEQAMDQFAGVLGPGPDGSGGGFMAKLDTLIDQNSTRIDTITTNLEEITTQIRRGEGTLGKLVYDETAYANLVSTMDEIRGAATEARSFVANTQGLIDQVKSGQGALGTLLYDVETGDNIRLTVQNLREVSDKLNRGEGTLGKLISDDSLFRDAQNTMQKVNRAVDSFSDQGPISAVGAAAGALF